MTVLAENSHGWVIDHLAATILTLGPLSNGDPLSTGDPLSKGSPPSKGDNSKDGDLQKERIKMKSALFEIVSPFIMDSQVQKVTAPDQTSRERKRKRKRKAPLSIGEQQAIDFHEEVREHMMTAYTSLLEQARSLGHYQTVAVKGDNNVGARPAARDHKISDVEPHNQESHMLTRQIVECTLTSSSIPAGRDVNTLWHYHGNTATTVTLTSGSQYVIPPQCTFLMSDLQVLLSNYKALGKFDLIVLDPPWENKSVKRKKKYSYLSNDELLSLPLRALSAPGCLVVVWVTNSYRHRQFVMEELFPKHGIHYLTQWFWLKVTCTGEMVYDFDSTHKKPYETLILGEVRDPGHQGAANRARPSGDRTIISVPCSLHSKKPPLIDLLKSYLPCQPGCLELFARNLQPYWTSWGNEVLLHQHLDYYEKIP